MNTLQTITDKDERSARVSSPFSFSPDPSGGVAAAPRSLRRSGSERREPAALGNTRIGFPAKARARAERHDLREIMGKITQFERLRKCGKTSIAPGGLIELRYSKADRVASYGKLATCGSVWACPVCAAKISAGRNCEVSHVLEHAVRQGKIVSMLTLTQRHHSGHELRDLWDSLSTAWNRVTSGRRWAEFKAQLGVIGYIKAVEVTHGSAGWHVHTHILFISDEDPATTPLIFERKQGRRRVPPPPEIVMPKQYVAERWAAGLAKKGMDFVEDRGGLDWETARDSAAVGRYIAKMGGQVGTTNLANEATLGSLKKARGGNRTPFQILADIAENPQNQADIKLWREWEQGSHGRRALTWSKGLREWAKLGDELSDEELAAQPEASDSEVLFEFDSSAWKEIRRAGPLGLLEATESGGRQGARRWLRRNLCDRSLKSIQFFEDTYTHRQQHQG